MKTENRPATTWLVNATEDYAALPAVCEKARKAGEIIHVIYCSRDREAILKLVPCGDEGIRTIELIAGSFGFPDLSVEADAEIFFLPCSELIDWTDLQQRAPLEYPHCIQLLFADPPRIHSRFRLSGPLGWFGWRAGVELARRILKEPAAWETNGINLVETIQHWPDPPRWQSVALRVGGSSNYPLASPPALTMSSRVLVVISFYRCEEWLNACLTSMVQQTRPADNIVVVDDCSPALPLELVEPFPNVTLLSTTRNAGPEKILNNIIYSTDYDAYMVQDPDDWSSHDRLELSMRGAEQTGADMVGTHEVCVDHQKGALELGVYPPDVNYAFSQSAGHPLLHATSLISRSLAMKVGGFDEKLKLIADVDFITRAWHAGRIINVPSFCFFRRVRAGSLTTDARTGYQSPARMLEEKFMTLRARKNLEMAQSGRVPDVSVKMTQRVGFIHHRGPKLRQNAGAGG